MNKIRSWIKLLCAPEITRNKILRLIRQWGDPVDFLSGSRDILQDCAYISPLTSQYLFNGREPQCWAQVEQLVRKFGIKCVSLLDPLYPPLLKNIYDPPVCLFYRGDISQEGWRRPLAVVGTRKPSNYGRIAAQSICRGLVKHGFTVVSGLAYGIDTVAHKSSLDNGGRTIAILGCGVEQIYPARNAGLAEMILNKGLLVSEYIPGSRIERWNFPARNRIISGLALGCLVVEGSRKSGAMLTGRFALDQNRDLYALPGDIGRPQAEGPNYLIKLGAKIVTCVEDIIEEYDLVMKKDDDTLPELTPAESRIYGLLLENRPEITLDKLLVFSGLNIGELSALLLTLEIKKVVKKLPGNRIMPIF
ncbi:MAG: DNA-processing protein DprA [Candidatus Cloacimonetes bacterium]|nr:DNA-processing protein DprA [Candidatus Cloacimonadota bacterium]